VIYVSIENKWLAGALTNSSYNIAMKERLMARYVLHIAFYAYLQYDGMKTLKNSENISQAALDSMMNASLEWGARSVLTSITSEQAFARTEDVDAA
jgi:hypothetical protein